METIWQKLYREGARVKATTLADFFAQNPRRFDEFSYRLDDLLLDFSKEHIDAPALCALLELVKVSALEARRDAMFAGAKINETESRAVLHCALRAGLKQGEANKASPPLAEMAEIIEGREKFLNFSEAVRSGTYRTAKGHIFTDIINIGIGGSHLGPHMAVQALIGDADGPKIHFASNIDGAHLHDILSDLDPTRTLIIISSKTFTTLETLTNARSVRTWLEKSLGKDTHRHLIAITSNIGQAENFGIDAENCFAFWDWVGGRYSLWSAIGMALALSIGKTRYLQFLQGANAMDAHFQSAPPAQNLPILLALIGVWRRNVMGWPSVAIIPYEQRLSRLPAYLQQLEMESNGKSISRSGDKTTTQTAPIIWGEPGTDAQHSFFQLIHQGTDIIPVDFILSAHCRKAMEGHHPLLVANCLAQSQALAFGKAAHEVREEMQRANYETATIDRLVPHRCFSGNRPSTLILQKALTPYSLGRLIALYEHKVFVQGVLWGINSFDQWGVELGKALTPALVGALEGAHPDLEAFDSSTAGLLAEIRAQSQSPQKGGGS